MRVVEVHPGEERPLPVGAEPLEGLVHHLRARTLDRVHAGHVAELLEVELVEVAVEALSDAPAPVEDEGANEAAGAVALVLEDLGQGHLLVAQVEAAVVSHSVPGGEGAGHE